MPKEGISVYFSGVDQMSPVLSSLADKTRALDKESQELQQTYNAMQKANQLLIEQRTTLKASLEEQKNRVSELRTEYKKYGDDMSGLKMQLAIEEQDALKDKLREVENQLSANRKAFNENREEIRKGLLEGGGGGLGGGGLDGGEQGTSLNDMAKGIFAGQIGQMFASSLGGLGQSFLTSAIGTPEASLIADTLSSAISGGAAGAVFGLPGMAIGAALGGASGLISGGTKIFEAKDDAFKDYYGGLYEDVKGRSGEMVEAGTSLASTRDTNRISFTTLFGGDENRARGYLEDLIDMANSTPFLYDDLVSMSKTLATYGYDDSNILPLLQTIGDAGAALGMSTSDMNTVATALGRMKSSDKAALEWLNILNDRGIGAVSMLAEAKGVSQGDMYSMISKGQISGTEAVEIITAALARDKKDGGFAGSMAEQSQTFAGISSTLEGLQQNLNALGGKGYNTLRQKGIQAEINALREDDGLGEAIGEINRIMGENQARKENLQDQYMRDVLDAVLNGNQGDLWDTFNQNQQDTLTEMSEKYSSLMERYQSGDVDAGAELESLYEQAQTLGQAYFDNSEEVARLNDVEEREVEAINKAIAPLETAHQRLYELNQTLSKGRAENWFGASGTGAYIDERGIVQGVDGVSGEAPGGTSGAGAYIDERGIVHTHAFGLSRVPYDDYPALLHRDERVLTASEARAQDAGQRAAPPSLTVTGNNFIGAPEELADQIWEIIVRKLERAYTAAAPK